MVFWWVAPIGRNWCCLIRVSREFWPSSEFTLGLGLGENKITRIVNGITTNCLVSFSPNPYLHPKQDEIHGSSLESTRGCLRISSNIVNPAARNYVDTRERDLDEVAGIYARNLRLYENHRQGRPNKYGVEIMFR